MGKQEAIRVLKSPLSGNINHNHWDGWCMTEEFAEAIDEAIKALRGTHSTVPDPETGLVPCGCGGKPEIRQWKSSKGEDVWYAICPDCHVATAECFWELAAKNDWNGSHGYKEDA